MSCIPQIYAGSVCHVYYPVLGGAGTLENDLVRIRGRFQLYSLILDFLLCEDIHMFEPVQL